MIEDLDMTSIVVVLGAFGLGYWLVSAVITKIKGKQPESADPDLRQDFPPRGGFVPPPPRRDEGSFRAASIYHEEQPDLQHARVLGLTGQVTAEDVRKAYHALLLQYHPDRVEHLGPELKEVAHRKTQQIVESYEYFRRKYRW
jgi:hypothetical protein